MSTIGERIKLKRKMAGLTQEQLANKVGISMMSIRRYESGERLVTDETLQKIAAALNVPPLYFLDDDFEHKRQKIRKSMLLEKLLLLHGYEFISDYEYNGKDCCLCLDHNKQKCYIVSDFQVSLIEKMIDKFLLFNIDEMLSKAVEIPDDAGFLEPTKKSSTNNMAELSHKQGQTKSPQQPEDCKGH